MIGRMGGKGGGDWKDGREGSRNGKVGIALENTREYEDKMGIDIKWDKRWRKKVYESWQGQVYI